MKISIDTLFRKLQRMNIDQKMYDAGECGASSTTQDSADAQFQKKMPSEKWTYCEKSYGNGKPCVVSHGSPGVNTRLSFFAKHTDEDARFILDGESLGICQRNERKEKKETYVMRAGKGKEEFTYPLFRDNNIGVSIQYQMIKGLNECEDYDTDDESISYAHSKSIKAIDDCIHQRVQKSI